MTRLELIGLFRSLLSAHARLDTARIERMGLLAVKIAQMYAVRPDIVGVEKSLELSRLLQRTEPMPAGEFERRWNELCPPSFKAVLKSRDAAPLASASLGQVHRATLRDGRIVVVKIARSDALVDFLADTERAKKLLRLGVAVYPRLNQLADPLGTLAAIQRQTLTEMNFLTEREGANVLANLAETDLDRLPHLRRLHFPEYFPQFSSDRFLVSELIEGDTVAQWLERKELPYSALLDLFRIHGYFLFVRGRFHGDLHPGNVIWRSGQFWFLDNANIETVPIRFARGLFSMLLLLGQGDLSRASNQLLQLSTQPLTGKKAGEFQSEFAALYRGFSGRTVGEISLTDQMMKTVKMAVHHGITFPGGAFPVIKSLMYLDGMVLRANPKAVLLRDVARFAADFQDDRETTFASCSQTS